MIDKRLLRKIKQECNLDLTNAKICDIDDILENSLIQDYKQSNIKPYSEWTLEELLTRQQELQQQNYKISVLYPQFYSEYYYQCGGEYYDLDDEIEARYWDKYQDYYPFYGQ